MNTDNSHLTESLISLLVQKIESFTGNYRTAWIQIKGFTPRNLRGTVYSNWNTIFLSILCEMKQYSLPIFMTFNQAREKGVSILKGKRSHPIVYFKYLVYHKETNAPIKFEVWKGLSKELKKQYKIIPLMRYYNVFNIDQTNFKEVLPEEYEKLINDNETLLPETNGFTCTELDDLLFMGNWDCQIHVRESNEAYYSLSRDYIVVPEKKQFPIQEEFYSTLLHEMAHSTGHPNRLDREMQPHFLDKNAYATEELIAELTSAIVGNILRISVMPSDNNVAYLKGWLHNLKEEPAYIHKLFSKVNNAVFYMTNKIAINKNVTKDSEYE